jgi:ubiquinone/menaquinone biosynthesis C-methylase UbiE
MITSGQFMRPDAVVTHFHILEGDTVADFGAGAGFYVKLLSDLVGPHGKVYACDIQKGLVEKIADIVHTMKLTNVYPLWCDFEASHGTKLADSVLDMGLLINTLFQIENRHAALQEFSRVIKSGGKLVIIDWVDSFGGLGPHQDHVITEASAREMLTDQGFIFERSFPAGDYHYGMIFRR